jgi:hypothetical protein
VADVDRAIAGTVDRMRQNAAARDRAMLRVKQVRDGELSLIAPDAFNDSFREPIVANMIDIAARSLAEAVAPLPALKCSAGRNVTQADKRRGEKKNRIGANYWRVSTLEEQMFTGADQYVTYAFLPFRLEPDYQLQLPRIVVDDPMGAYYELDRAGKCVRYARKWRQVAGEIAALFSDDPVIVGKLTRGKGDWGQEIDLSDSEVEVTYYVDTKTEYLYVGERDVVLQSIQHGYGFCPVRIAERPGLSNKPRGQFDDAVYIQVARAVFASLALEAAHKTVQAPIQMPTDVVELNIGADAVLRTDGQIKRVDLNVSPQTFAFDQKLDAELRLGSRIPDARLGQQSASVITGRGVEELMGSYDSQIKAAQTIIGIALREITSLAFRMDMKLWPTKRQTINGVIAGESYQITYSPAEDIADDYTCDITYGFMAGLSPQNAAVLLLQLRGDGLIDRDMFRRQMPWDMDADATQRQVDIEETEDALKQALFAALQASGQIIAAGQTDTAMGFFNAAAALIKGRQAGKDTASVLTDFFTQQAAEQQAKLQQQQQDQAAAGGQGGPPGPGGGAPGAIPGSSDTGLPDGVAPGQAGMAPGGMPSIQQLVAGVTGGHANMAASVRKRVPTG